MTLLFQDDNGGLELKDPHSGVFISAKPEEGALVLNVGDMLQRFTNGMLPHIFRNLRLIRDRLLRLSTPPGGCP